MDKNRPGAEGQIQKNVAGRTELMGEENESGTRNPESDLNPFSTEETIEIIPPAAKEDPQTNGRKIKPKKREFNPWAELDKASKKTVSRRDLITGLFRFLPKNGDK